LFYVSFSVWLNNKHLRILLVYGSQNVLVVMNVSLSG